jgi:hypothetical protein
VEAARGKVIFLLDQRSVGAAYLRGHVSLRGRMMFTNATPGRPTRRLSSATSEELVAVDCEDLTWCTNALDRRNEMWLPRIVEARRANTKILDAVGTP